MKTWFPCSGTLLPAGFSSLKMSNLGSHRQILQLINTTDLPGHFYALASKKEVFEYIKAHDNAIGIIDYVTIGDSDSAVHPGGTGQDSLCWRSAGLRTQYSMGF